MVNPQTRQSGLQGMLVGFVATVLAQFCFSRACIAISALSVLKRFLTRKLALNATKR